MDMEDVLLLLHLLGAFLIVAGAGTATVLGPVMARMRNTQALAALIRPGRIIPWLTHSGAFVVLITGSWLVTEEGRFDFDQGWLIASYVLWIAVMALSFLGLGPHQRELERLAEEAAEAGDEENEDLIAAVNAPRGMIMGAVANLITVAILVLMVFKPGA